MSRTPLPNRRPNLTVTTDWNGHPLSVTVGFRPDGTVGEVFADTAKGGQMGHTLADACCIISIALQHGIPPAALSKSLGVIPTRTDGFEEDRPASPIGAILAIIAEVGA
jgi:hypothetical protein